MTPAKAKYPKIRTRYVKIPGTGKHCVYTSNIIPYDVSGYLDAIVKSA